MHQCKKKKKKNMENYGASQMCDLPKKYDLPLSNI